MDEKIDKGRLLSQRKISIEKNDTFHSLYIKCHRDVPDMLFDVLEQISKCRVPKQKTLLSQIDPKKSKLYSYPEQHDVRLFRKTGKRFF